MKKRIVRGSVYRLGERGTRRKKPKPLKGKELAELIKRNEALAELERLSMNPSDTPGGSKSLPGKVVRPQPQQESASVNIQGGGYD